MKSKIFNTDQVRAIQDGRMTQFMQVVKPQPEVITGDILNPFKWYAANKNDFCGDIDRPVKCPFGKVGDVITVKEIWIRGITIDENEKPVNDNPPRFWYKADNNAPEWYRPELSDDHPNYLTPPWKSPATMPREAARLFLRITNIRVMRVQELTKQDARAQGHETDIVYGDIWTPHDFLPGGTENLWYWVIDFTKIDKP